MPVRVRSRPGSAPAGWQRVIGQIDGRAVMRAFQRVRAEHPEVLLTDDEIRAWLETGNVPAIPPGEARPLWLTIESPRVDAKKLKAHVAVDVTPDHNRVHVGVLVGAAPRGGS